MPEPTVSYSVNLDMETIQLPPVTDILVIARKLEQGKKGIMESFRFLAPDEFELIDIDSESTEVEAILINKRILNRMPKKDVLKVLEKHVFPNVSYGEAVRVNFKVKITIDSIKGEIKDEDR